MENRTQAAADMRNTMKRAEGSTSLHTFVSLYIDIYRLRARTRVGMYMHVHPHTQCQNIYMYIYTVYIPYALSFCSTHMQLGITTVKKNYILTEDKLSSRNKNIWKLAIINSHLTAAFIKTCLHSLRNYLALHIACISKDFLVLNLMFYTAQPTS